MAKIKKFEEIKSWKKARTLIKQIYEVTSIGSFRRDFGLKDQDQASFGFYTLEYCRGL